LRQSETLLSLGMKEMAALCMKSAVIRYPPSLEEVEYARYLGNLAYRAGLYMEALSTLSENRDPEKRKPTNPDLLLDYPRPFLPEFIAAGEEFKLEPELLMGLAKQESAFTADILSESLGYGILQIQEKTGQLIARSLHLANFRRSMLFD